MSRNSTSKLLGLVLLITVIFCGSFSAAFAATGLTIQPTKVSHTLKPGERLSGNIRLSSASDGDAIQVEASVEDFVPVAGAESIQFVGRAPGVTTVRDWITLGGDKIFKLKEGEAVNIPYTITAPFDAEPGSHFGVAFFKATRPSIGGVQQLSIGTRIGMLILITVPGSHLQKGKILDFAGPSFIQKLPADFKIKFENLGTVHFEPKGTLAISNMFGSVGAKVPIEGQTVLPTGIKDINVSWRAEGWLLGKYNAVATLFDGEGTAMTTSSVSFWVIPVWYILGALISVIILFLVFRWVRRRVRISIVSE